MSLICPHRGDSRPAQGTLEVRLLGLLDFNSALGLQDWITYEVSGRVDAGGVLLLCEHPPAISIGRQGSRSQIAVDQGRLSACEVAVHWVSRGGGTVVHMPGQLAAYLLLPLDRLQLGLSEFRRRFESALLAACHDLRVPVKRLEDSPGLWTRGGQVGHFGATVKSWVTQHGMWLNVAPEPSFLKLVHSELTDHRLPAEPTTASHHTAGGVVEQRVTSLQDQLLRRITMHAAREATMRNVAEAFHFETVHTFTGHPQLTRTRRRICVTA